MIPNPTSRSAVVTFALGSDWSSLSVHHPLTASARHRAAFDIAGDVGTGDELRQLAAGLNGF
jgi:hypothetical protein